MTKVLYFDSGDMFGNPYDFVGGVNQEKIFDTSDIDKIEKIVLYFFQGNDFVDINDIEVPAADVENIFARDIYLSLDMI